MKKMLALIMGILVAGTIMIPVYSSAEQKKALNNKIINKAYIGYVFSSQGKLIKKIPIKLEGKQYLEGFYRDYFEGTIYMNGKVVHIISTKDKKACFADMDVKKFYGAQDLISVKKLKLHGMAAIETFIAISKDFKIIYGTSNNILKEFGKGAYFKSDKNFETIYDYYAKYRNEEPKRISLYIETLKKIYKKRHSRNQFIAVKTETFDGVEDEIGWGQVLAGLSSLSPNVYNYQYIKNEKDKFQYGKNGSITKILNGILFYLKVNKYNGNEAIITATSWVNTNDSISIKYKGIYTNGKWQVKQ